MTNGGNDSPGIAGFMALFARLKDWSDDAPDELLDLAKNDSSVKELCNQVYFIAVNLRDAENSQQEMFAAPVDPEFQAAWREYEERYELTLFKIDCWDGGERWITIPPAFFPDFPWLAANLSGTQAASAFSGILFAALAAEDNLDALLTLVRERTGEDTESEPTTVREGLAVWDHLTEKIGFDLSGVIRRHRLIPFVLIPRHF